MIHDENYYCSGFVNEYLDFCDDHSDYDCSDLGNFAVIFLVIKVLLPMIAMMSSMTGMILEWMHRFWW